jgi:DNA-binding NtrC family response regulator
VITLHLPPLRDREDDVAGLAEYFLRASARKTGASAPHRRVRR